jgi:hypothetical protein
MRTLDAEAQRAGITVLNEVGVDPGMDHLYAIKKIDEVHARGGLVCEFHSYCASAMATSVGVTCGMATQAVLDGEEGFARRGVWAPYQVGVYEVLRVWELKRRWYEGV